MTESKTTHLGIIGLSAAFAIIATMATIEDRPVAQFAETWLAALFVVYGVLLPFAIFKYIEARLCARLSIDCLCGRPDFARQRNLVKAASFVVALIAFVAIALLAMEIPGVGWRIQQWAQHDSY